jgi:hypothetical protein
MHAPITEHSKDAKVFCLIHKMDLIPEDQRDMVFSERVAELKRRSIPLEVTCFKTSIWDETLYKAWSSIVVSLISNVSALQKHLGSFAKIMDADEVRAVPCPCVGGWHVSCVVSSARTLGSSHRQRPLCPCHARWFCLSGLHSL